MASYNDRVSVRWVGWDRFFDRLETAANALLAEEVEAAAVSGDRGSGRTSEQMLADPQWAVFVWCNEQLIYPRQLAKRLHRRDLRIVGPSWLEDEGWRGSSFSAVVLDHALRLTDGQRRGLSGLLSMVRMRGETVKISQTPERKELTPGKAVYDAVVQAAAAWERTLAVLAHAASATEMSREAAGKCVREAMEHQMRLSSIISDASDAMEECVDAGQGQEARAWIDALDEMRRIGEAVGVAVRLANGNSSDPYHPQSLDWMWKAEERARRKANLRDGEPCGHPGCLSHVSHPCEGCGRVAGRREG